MGSRESREDKLAGIGVALIDAHLGAALADVDDLVDILEVQLRIDTLGEHVVSNCQNIDVSGSLAVSEESSLHALCAGKKSKLCSCHAASSVVVRVHTQNDAVSVLEMAAHPLDLVRVNIGSRQFYCRGEVEDHRLFRGGLPDILHCRADLQGKIQLCAGKALGGILEKDLSGELLCSLLDPLGSLNRGINDGLFVLAEHHVPLKGGCGVIDVDNRLFAAADGLKSLLDLVFPALGEDLYEDVIRDHILLDQLSEEIVFDLAGCRESDLDLLESQFHKEAEQIHFLTDHHRVDQSLIAVTKIHADPCGCLLDLFVRPFSLRIIHYRCSPVLLIATHLFAPLSSVSY